MSARLWEVLEDVTTRESNGLRLSLQTLYNNRDRTVEDVSLTYSGPDSPATLIMVIGLRSRILSSFPRFSTESPNFNPCDIPALVPLVALLANGVRGLDDGGFIHEDSTRILLQFSGEQTRSTTSLKALAVNVHQFMTLWEQWVKVLLGTLVSDPNIRDWRIDWHELLAGESGYVAMPWFPEVPLTDRALALDRIVTASRALLNSVLKMGFQKNELVEELVNWLDGLKPQPEVLRAEVFAEQEVV